jgi:predicted RNA-binding Zn-ribbon protein involved in translation (DUF1610 family)
LKETTTPTCPECGEELALIENSTLLSCPQCGIVRFIRSFPARDLRIKEGDLPAINVHTLIGEVKILERQLQTLSDRWGLVDLVRNIGLILVLTGIGYALLSSMTSLSLLNYGVYAILSGIFLHGGSQLVGKDYYIRKAFLEELILIKQHEIEQQRSRPLAIGRK